MSYWKWRVRCTYNNTAIWPKVPGELAIETTHADDVSCNLEVKAALGRRDVDIQVLAYDTGEIAAVIAWGDNPPLDEEVPFDPELMKHLVDNPPLNARLIRPQK